MQLDMIEKRKGESAREYVTRLLKFNIINLKLQPGKSISENEVASMLNLSRTPVREAFIRLELDRLITVFPQKGTIVSKIDPDRGEEGRFVRRVVERELVKQACEAQDSTELIISLEEALFLQKFYLQNGNTQKIIQTDDEFHWDIFSFCKMQRTYSAIEVLNYDYYRIRMMRVDAGVKLDRVYSQHQAILEAIKSRDAQTAQQIMEEHLNDKEYDLQFFIKKYPEYFLL